MKPSANKLLELAEACVHADPILVPEPSLPTWRNPLLQQKAMDEILLCIREYKARKNKRGSEDYLKGSFYRAAEEMLPSVAELEIAPEDTDGLTRLVRPVITALNTTFYSDEHITEDKVRLFFEKNLRKKSPNELIKIRFCELFGIAMTYVVKLHTYQPSSAPPTPAQVAAYLNADLTLIGVRDDFAQLQALTHQQHELSTEEQLQQSLDSISRSLVRSPGRVAADYFALQERIKVQRARIKSQGKNNHPDFFKQTSESPSPYEMVAMATPREWGRFQRVFANKTFADTYHPRLIGSNIARDYKQRFHSVVKKCFESEGCLVQQFYPLTVRLALNYLFQGGRVGNVLDCCGGWGDRYLGYASMLSTTVNGVVIQGDIYVNDVNPNMLPMYESMQNAYLPTNLKNRSHFTAKAAEALTENPIYSNELTERMSFCCTSPPYFVKELYEGADSSHKYGSYRLWKSNFLVKMSEQLGYVMNDMGWVLLVVSDLRAKGKSIMPLVQDTKISMEGAGFDFFYQCAYGKSKSKALQAFSGALGKCKGETMLFFRKKTSLPREIAEPEKAAAETDSTDIAIDPEAAVSSYKERSYSTNMSETDQLPIAPVSSVAANYHLASAIKVGRFWLPTIESTLEYDDIEQANAVMPRQAKI